VIDLYYWTTPNGHKVTMFLEETGSYTIHPINIGKGEQFRAEFLTISRTTAFLRSSITRQPTAARRSGCSNQARSCSIWPTRSGA
jgi:GST-like protein